MDNRVFNVNGSGEAMLLRTLVLCFEQSGSHTMARSWAFMPKKGLVLMWSDTAERVPVMKFIAPLDAARCAPMIVEWLKSDQASAMHAGLEDWDRNLAHDGDNSLGWRVYTEGWGQVAGCNYAICAITPAFMWHGK